MQLSFTRTRALLFLWMFVLGANRTAHPQQGDSPIIVSGSSLTVWSVGGFAATCAATNDLCVSQAGKTPRSLEVYNNRNDMQHHQNIVQTISPLSGPWTLHFSPHSVHITYNAASLVTIHPAAGSWGPHLNDPDLHHGYKHSDNRPIGEVNLDNAACPGGHCRVQCPSGTCWIQIHYF
jgi:hypothetical protein